MNPPLSSVSQSPERIATAIALHPSGRQRRPSARIAVARASPSSFRIAGTPTKTSATVPPPTRRRRARGGRGAPSARAPRLNAVPRSPVRKAACGRRPALPAGRPGARNSVRGAEGGGPRGTMGSPTSQRPRAPTGDPRSAVRHKPRRSPCGCRLLRILRDPPTMSSPRGDLKSDTVHATSAVRQEQVSGLSQTPGRSPSRAHRRGRRPALSAGRPTAE